MSINDTNNKNKITKRKSKWLFFFFMIIVSLPPVTFPQDTLTKKQWRRSQKNFLETNKHRTIEAPLWVPGFAGSFAYGDVLLDGENGIDPENPTEPPSGGIIGSVLAWLFRDEWYLNFFFLTRVAYEKNNFITQFDARRGTVGGSVKFKLNNREIVKVRFTSVNFRIFAGYKLAEFVS